MTIFQKILYPLGGFLIGTLLMVTSLKITGTFWGVFIGMLLDCAVSWYFLKKLPKQQDKKLIAYGLISSVITIGVAGLGIWIFASVLLNGITS